MWLIPCSFSLKEFLIPFPLSRNRESRKSYLESYGSLRALKDLRQVVASLASDIDKGIEKMEREVLPVSRYQGIRSLPGEVIVKIMTLVANQFEEPKAFKSTMFSFLQFSPFGAHFEEATDLVSRWERTDCGWDGRLPQETSMTRLDRMTVFHLSMQNTYSLAEIRDGLEPLRALEHLQITCRFEYDRFTEEDDYYGDISTSDREVERRLLPNLKKLSISNLTQFDFGSFEVPPDEKEAGEPLRQIIAMLDMENVTHISARLFSLEMPGASLRILNEVFNFGNVVYPNVRTFELGAMELACHTAFASLDLSDAFSSLGALRELTLGSCDTIIYGSRIEDIPEGLRDLRLVFMDRLSCVETLGSVVEMGCFWGDLQGIEMLRNVEVVTMYEDVFKEVQEFFPGALRVTDKSILDRNFLTYF